MPRQGRIHLGSVALSVVAIAVLLLLYLPATVMGIQSFNAADVPGFPISQWGLRWYDALVADGQFLQAFLNSVLIASATTVVSTLIGTAAAFGLARYRLPGRDALMLFVLLPLITPTLILAVALLLFFNALGMSGSMVQIVIGHVVYTTPVVTLFVTAGLIGLPRITEDAAANLGAPPLTVLRRITLPQIAAPLFAGAIFTFALSLDELPIGFFNGGGTNTYPVFIWASFRYVFNPELYSLGTMLGIATGVGTVITWVLLLRNRRLAIQEEIEVNRTAA